MIQHLCQNSLETIGIISMNRGRDYKILIGDIGIKNGIAFQFFKNQIIKGTLGTGEEEEPGTEPTGTHEKEHEKKGCH